MGFFDHFAMSGKKYFSDSEIEVCGRMNGRNVHICLSDSCLATRKFTIASYVSRWVEETELGLLFRDCDCEVCLPLDWISLVTQRVGDQVAEIALETERGRVSFEVPSDVADAVVMHIATHMSTKPLPTCPAAVACVAA